MNNTFLSYKKLLSEFVKFKSISTDSHKVGEVEACANWLVDLFKKNNFKVNKFEGYGNPIIVASYEFNQDLETCLIYGHYDVQPASIEEGWSEDPFAIVEKDNRLYARGSVDNKGQVMVHIATVLDLIASNDLKYNIKFIIEGDEETGSEQVDKFFEDNVDSLKCDFVLISDGELTMNYPVINVAFRGFINSTLEITTSLKDNHSGLYGGSIPNAANELSEILSRIHDEKGSITIPGIDNKNLNIPREILEANKKIPFIYEEFKNNTGSKIKLNEEMDFYTQVGMLTSVEITTLESGYRGEGYRNAIPGRASAKVNFRISPFLTVEDVKTAFDEFVKTNLPYYCEYKLSFDQPSEPIKLDDENDHIRNAKKLLESVYEKEAFFKYCGAIIPIAGYFAQILNVPVLDIGLGNEDCNMHGVNENFEIRLIEKGLEFSRKFLGK